METLSQNLVESRRQDRSNGQRSKVRRSGRFVNFRYQYGPATDPIGWRLAHEKDSVQEPPQLIHTEGLYVGFILTIWAAGCVGFSSF